MGFNIRSLGKAGYCFVLHIVLELSVNKYLVHKNKLIRLKWAELHLLEYYLRLY